MLNRRLSVAPMMDYTDRHDRYFLRLISRQVLLYTEMVTTGAVLHGDYQRLLAFDPMEHPVALQLGGSDPLELARCARIVEELGYDEVNLNAGCPSDRVQSGRFGACLMAEPELVAECMRAMKEAVDIPVTIKTRIGINDQDSYSQLAYFVDRIAAAGCQVFIIHARKAWLRGLSPKENREIPPLCYEVVYRLKNDFPDLDIIINGGITDLIQAGHHLQFVDGAMIGRAAYHNPYLLAPVDQGFFGATTSALTRHQVIEHFLSYVERQLIRGTRLSSMTRHILGLFQGQPGARSWRHQLSENAHRPGAGVEVITGALTRIPELNPADALAL